MLDRRPRVIAAFSSLRQRCVGRILLVSSLTTLHSQEGDEVPYNPDAQYSSGLLVCVLILQLWKHLGQDDRRELLQYLAKYEYPKNHDLYRPIRPGPFKDFLKAKLRMKHKTKKKVENAIAKLVQWDGPLENPPPQVDQLPNPSSDRERKRTHEEIDCTNGSAKELNQRDQT